MIEVFYKLVTNTGKGFLEYETIPEFKSLDNISLIEAPNDFGKSTIFHCLAISCYGEHDQYIQKKIDDQGLIDKIDWLLKPSPTEVEFDITIKAHGTTLHAKKELNKGHIERHINGERATFEDFKEKFDIVYQIPSDPVRRLNDIIKDVQSNVQYYGTLLSKHHENIGRIIEDLDQDPKERRKIINDRIDKYKEKEETLGSRFKDFCELEVNIQKYLYIRQIEDYTNTIKQRSDRKTKLLSIIRSSNFITSNRTKTVEAINTFNTDIRTATKNYLKIVGDLELDSDIITGYTDFLEKFDIPNDFKCNKGEQYWNSIREINEVVQDIDENLVDETKADNTEYLRQLKSFLETFPPSLNDESITTPIDVLLKEIDSYLGKYSDLEYHDAFEQIYDIFKDIDKLVDIGVDEYNIYVNLPDEDRDAIDQDSYREEIEGLKIIIAELENSKKMASVHLVSLGLDDETKCTQFVTGFNNNYSKYKNYQLSKLEITLIDTTKTKKEIAEDIRKNEVKIQALRNELDDLKGKDRDEFSGHKKEIEKIEEILQSLRYKLENEMMGYLDRKDQTAHISEVEENFKQQLQSYLAKKIPEIPINENGEDIKLKVKRIDHIQKIFITDEDKIIDFRMFGSGRTSSIGYTSTINNLNPKKLTILLLDEALMDDVSIAPLKNAINKQYDKGILFAGILARYSSKINVESLIE